MEERILFTPVGAILKNIFSTKTTKSTIHKARAVRAVERSNSFEAGGSIKHLSGSSMIVDGKKIELSDETWVIGHLREDSYALVKGVIRDDDSLFAKKIVIRASDA